MQMRCKRVIRISLGAMVACPLLLVSGVVSSEESGSSTWECASGGYGRVIELFRNDYPEDAASMSSDSGFACRVVYTKNGDSEVLWQARNDPDYCEPRVLALLETLTSAGFRCLQAVEAENGADRHTVSAVEPVSATPLPPPVEPPQARSDDGNSAVRAMLAKHYEDSYLDAMVAAMPPGFTVHPDRDGLVAERGGFLHIAPPNHFVKTLPDGSYVLVNTLLLQRGSTSSFVNLGFAVTNSRYRFLGYAAVHSAVQATVMDADSGAVALMVTTAETPSCEASRRMQTLRWIANLEIDAGGDCNN